jgi:hypothetical protein
VLIRLGLLVGENDSFLKKSCNDSGGLLNVCVLSFK